MKEIVVISGKGGTGKTSLVAGMAASGPSKVLADCDVDAADLHLVLDPRVEATQEFISGELASIDPQLCSACGLCLNYCRFGAITQDFRIIPEYCEGCALCYHVCPENAVRLSQRRCGEWYRSQTRFGPMIHAHLDIGQENSGKLVTLVRKESQRVAQDKGLGTVLTDGSPGVGCPVIASLTNASMVLLVTEPTVTAFADLRRVLDLTAHFQLPCLGIINKADINPELTRAMENFFHHRRVDLLSTLSYDPDFTRAQILRQSVVEYNPEKWSSAMDHIWRAIDQKSHFA